jgi:hypothetical protein
MKDKVLTARRLDIVGNGGCSSEPETVTATVRKWRQRFGYCSIFAAVPTMLISQVPAARSDEAKKPEVTVTGDRARLFEKVNTSSPALLKRQSKFLLPHQLSSVDPLTPFAGNDDCPGRLIPGGNYTAAAPYIDSGDTTGANDTVSRIGYYYYYTFDTSGPDNFYSFMLSGVGPNPQIQVSTSSGTYKPLIYVLQGGFPGACQGGTGNTAWANVVAFSSGGAATLGSRVMNFLPLNVPLYLVVDSAHNDSSGSGPYTLQMQDVTIGPPCSNANAIDCTEFMVRQHYIDFLNREPDAAGLAFWTNEITSCGGDLQCVEIKRLNVSAAFFLSIEFQETGYLVYKTYAAAFGATRIGSTVPLSLNELFADVRRVGQGVVVGMPGWEALLDAKQAAYFDEFVQRPAFIATYPPTITNAQYVDALNTNAGGVLSTSKRDQLVSDLLNSAKTRAQVLRAVAEDTDFTRAHFNRAFVLMQYFGYLRRNPNTPPDNTFDGYKFWVEKLDRFNGNYIEAEMIKAFITSNEYRQRFGQQ